MAKKQTRYDIRETAGQMRLPTTSDRVYYEPPPQMLADIDWRPPRVEDLPSSWRDVKRLSIDIETRDEDLTTLGPGVRRSGSYICGVSFAIEDGPDFYLPFRHEGGDNCSFDVLSYLRDRMREFNGVLTGAGLQYEIDWLAEANIPLFDKDVRDIQVIDPLLYELHLKYGLNALCERYNLPGKDEATLRATAKSYRVDPKKGIWRLPARFVANYARVDARRPLQILRRQEARLDDENTHGIWELERQVTPILVKMRRRGVRIDQQQLERISELSIAKEAEFLAHVYHLTGVRVAVGDVWKTGPLAQVVRSCGRKVPRTDPTKQYPKGKESVTNDILEKCGEAGKVLVRARKWNKLRTTFCEQVKRFMVNGRAHCTFNQLRAEREDGDSKGVRYGRLSSTDFNIQNQPVRDDEFGDLWRAVFVPDEDAEWACSDWSQQEPRIGVHYAEILKLEGAKEFADEYRRNPALDIHQTLTDIGNEHGAGLERKTVKNFVNGRLYGMGDPKLCRSFELPVIKAERYGKMRDVPGPECQAIIDSFRQFAPWIEGLTKVASRIANERGYVRTILGRVLHFERGPDGKYWQTHKAFNRIGQGGAADQMKATLVAADKEGIPVQMAVHDEFDLSWTDIRVPRRLAELQRTVVRFNVPMKVDLDIGPSWGELRKDDGR